MKIKVKQKLTKEWFAKLQNIICDNVEQLEKEFGSNIKFKRVAKQNCFGNVYIKRVPLGYSALEMT